MSNRSKSYPTRCRGSTRSAQQGSHRLRAFQKNPKHPSPLRHLPRKRDGHRVGKPDGPLGASPMGGGPTGPRRRHRPHPPTPVAGGTGRPGTSRDVPPKAQAEGRMAPPPRTGSLATRPPGHPGPDIGPEAMTGPSHPPPHPRPDGLGEGPPQRWGGPGGIARRPLRPAASPGMPARAAAPQGPRWPNRRPRSEGDADPSGPRPGAPQGAGEGSGGQTVPLARPLGSAGCSRAQGSAAGLVGWFSSASFPPCWR